MTRIQSIQSFSILSESVFKFKANFWWRSAVMIFRRELSGACQVTNRIVTIVCGRQTLL